jgi:hypothetical protein
MAGAVGRADGGVTGVMRGPEGNEVCVEPGPGDSHEPSGR